MHDETGAGRSTGQASEAPPRMPAHGAAGRTLGTGAAIALVSGSMLGVGIFIAPPVVAEHLPDPWAFVALWWAGGMSALFGALSVAELGAMMPRAGGDYPYLRLAYGPALAFAAGWLQLLAVFPGSLATMAVGAATFQLPELLGGWVAGTADLGIVEIAVRDLWACAIVIGLTAVNHLGIVLSGRFQIWLTAVPFVVFLVAGIGVLAIGPHPGSALADPGTGAGTGITGLAHAYLAVYFAYSGWNSAIFVGAEIRAPARNLPRALLGGTVAVMFLYLILCGLFLALFSAGDLARAGEAGSAAAAKLFGPHGRTVMTLLILVTLLGSLNGTIMAGSRIAYAMAGEGHCFAAAGRLAPGYGTPVTALWMQAAWTVVLVLSQRFERLMAYTAAAMLVTGTLTALAVVVLRRRLPEAPRPYRTWGYPWPPLLYAVSSLLALGVLAGDRDPSLGFAAAWFGAAWAGYGLWARKRRAAS